MKFANREFESQKLILRPWTMDDAEDFFEYARVEGVGELAGWPHHESIDQTKAVLQMFLKESTCFAIVYKENNKVIGSIDLRDEANPLPEDKDKRNANMGCVLSKDYWGQGLMPEAAKILFDYVFENDLVDNIYAGYFDHNIQSKRLQEKLGFNKVGEIDKKTATGKVEHLIVNKISKNEWLKSRE